MKFRLLVIALSFLALASCGGDKKTIVKGGEDLAAREDILDMQSEITSLHQRINELEAQLVNAETAVTDLNSEVGSVAQKVDDIESLVILFNDDLGGVQESLAQSQLNSPRVYC